VCVCHAEASVHVLWVVELLSEPPPVRHVEGHQSAGGRSHERRADDDAHQEQLSSVCR